MRYFTAFLLLVILFTACNDKTTNYIPKEITTNTLLGSWEMKGIEWISADTVFTIAKAQPGIFMIDADRYSLIWTPTQEPRKAFEVLAAPTEEEIRAGFRSIVFNSGSYSLTDSTLTTKAVIAKVPGFEGGMQYYRYQLTKDSLVMTMYDETYPNGSKPDWSGQWQTRFRMQRITNP